MSFISKKRKSKSSISTSAESCSSSTCGHQQSKWSTKTVLDNVDDHDFLIFTQLSCVVISLFYRALLINSTKTVKNAYFLLTGLAIIVWTYPEWCYHLIVMTIINYTLLTSRRVDHVTITLSFFLNLLYPLTVKYILNEDEYNPFWSITALQFIVKSVSLAMELKDKEELRANGSNGSGCDKIAQITPDDYLGYMFYPFSLIGGSLISYEFYKSVVRNDNVTSSLVTLVPSFGKVLISYGVYKTGSIYLHKFVNIYQSNANVLAKLFLYCCHIKLLVLKYVSLTVAAEFVGIAAGVKFVKNNNKYGDSGPKSIDLIACFTPMSFYGFLNTFGGSTYQWIHKKLNLNLFGKHQLNLFGEIVENLFLFALLPNTKLTVIALGHKSLCILAEKEIYSLGLGRLGHEYSPLTVILQVLKVLFTNCAIGYLYIPLLYYNKSLKPDDFELFEHYYFSGHVFLSLFCAWNVIKMFERLRNSLRSVPNTVSQEPIAKPVEETTTSEPIIKPIMLFAKDSVPSLDLDFEDAAQLNENERLNAPRSHGESYSMSISTIHEEDEETDESERSKAVTERKTRRVPLTRSPSVPGDRTAFEVSPESHMYDYFYEKFPLYYYSAMGRRPSDIDIKLEKNPRQRNGKEARMVYLLAKFLKFHFPYKRDLNKHVDHFNKFIGLKPDKVAARPPLTKYFKSHFPQHSSVGLPQTVYVNFLANLASLGHCADLDEKKLVKVFDKVWASTPSS